jgi:hypothetical protein
MIRASPHVYLRQAGYYSRLAVPEGVRGMVGKHPIHQGRHYDVMFTRIN